MEGENKMEKTVGYLDKKGKLKVLSPWKKYWFVLEGRLLVYYRSKDEYDFLSPCKGTINLGPPCTVKSCPSVQGVFMIETRANTVKLRSEDQTDQNRWMQAIMSALNQNVKANQAKLSHFRYSLDNLVPQPDVVETSEIKTKLARQYSMHNGNKAKTIQNNQNKLTIDRLQKMGAHSYGGSLNQIKIVNNTFKKQDSLKKRKNKDKTNKSTTELNQISQEDINEPDICIMQNLAIRQVRVRTYEEIPDDHKTSKSKLNEMPQEVEYNEIADINEQPDIRQNICEKELQQTVRQVRERTYQEIPDDHKNNKNKLNKMPQEVEYHEVADTIENPDIFIMHDVSEKELQQAIKVRERNNHELPNDPKNYQKTCKSKLNKLSQEVEYTEIADSIRHDISEEELQQAIRQVRERNNQEITEDQKNYQKTCERKLNNIPQEVEYNEIADTNEKPDIKHDISEEELQQAIRQVRERNNQEITDDPKNYQKTSKTKLNNIPQEVEYNEITDSNEKPDICIRHDVSEKELRQAIRRVRERVIFKSKLNEMPQEAEYNEIGDTNENHDIRPTTYEEIPGDIKNVTDNEILLRKDYIGDNIYERISGESNKSLNQTRIQSFMIDNDNYSIPNKQSLLKRLSSDNNKNSVIIENDQYCSLAETKKLQEENTNSDSAERNSASNSASNILVENDQYQALNELQNINTVIETNVKVETEVEIYNEIKINTANSDNTEANNVNTNPSKNEYSDVIKKRNVSENLYEDIEGIYCELKLDSETSSQSSAKHKKHKKNKIKTFFCTKKSQSDKNLNSINFDEEKHYNKLRKSSSFINRVFRRKNKNLRDKEGVYEEISTFLKNEKNESNCEELPSMKEKPKLQKTLSENLFQNLHEELKNKQEKRRKAKSDNSEKINTELPWQVLPEQPHSSTQKAVKKPQIPSKKNLKSIDKILIDLDKEKLQKDLCKGSIKLRNHPHIEEITYRHSEDLDALLNKLLKVTSAPIMPPGVTNSLINPTLNDEEWLKLLPPVRKRRMSDPDYDIPRPHKSLQTIISKEEVLLAEPAITATRFFGPVLDNSNNDSNNNNSSSTESLIFSMTPDSLEPLEHKLHESKINKLLPISSTSEDKDASYNSHNYQLNNNKISEETEVLPSVKEVQCNTCKFRKDNKDLDHIIYAKPKYVIGECKGSYNKNHAVLNYRKKPTEVTSTYKTEKNIVIDGKEEIHGKVHDVFVDSLEHCAEISTAF